MIGTVGRYAQGAVAKKPQPLVRMRVMDDSVAGARTSIAPYTGVALIFIWGAGGSGAAASTGTLSSGSAGGAVYKRIRVKKGQMLSYSIGSGGAGVYGGGTNNGNPGSGTTITIPDGRILAATGGGGGRTDGVVPPPGTGAGGDINRTGGLGGVQGGVAGTTGEFGSVAGAFSGGGGAAGFNDDIGLVGGPGSQGNSGASTPPTRDPGAGSGFESAGIYYSQSGGSGRVLILYVSQQ